MCRNFSEPFVNRSVLGFGAVLPAQDIHAERKSGAVHLGSDGLEVVI
jgi:hypothetical protein